MPELDGVRGIAILLVLIFHFGTLPTDRVAEKVIRMALGMSLGWSGVDLFLVLSGFLITGILLEARESPRYFPSFYMRRVVRIFPLYFAALLVACATGYLAPRESLWYWSYLSNWRTAFGPHSPALTHFWSLAVEEQFYMVWPVLVLACSEKRLRALCLAIVAGVLTARTALAWHVEPPVLYRLTVFRMDSLALGALAVLAIRDPALRRQVRRWLAPVTVIGISAVALALVLSRTPSSSSPWMSSFGFTGLGLAYATLVFRAADRTGGSGRLERFCRHRWLIAFGKYSYGLYVVHLPISLFTIAALERVAQAAGLRYSIGFALASVVGGTAASFGVAMLSWKWLEAPCLRQRARFPY